MKRFLASAALILSLSACASALDSATQDVTVLTPGAHESFCYIDNGAVVYRTWPPQTIKISKKPGRLKVRCVADGNREKTVVIEPEHQPVVLANAFNGFVPGLFTDYKTGAMFIYPHTITVDFTDMKAQKMPRPDYDLHLQDNPELFGMEEFRPGDAALMRDKYDEPIELRKRQVPGSVPVITGEPAEESGAGIDKDVPPLNQGPSGESAESLTRKMNPQVFGPSSNGFAGRTAQEPESGNAAGAPLPLQPAE